MSNEADTLYFGGQITSESARAYLHALVRSYHLASAVYVAHVIPGRPPNAPIVCATHVDDLLFDYLRRHQARFDEIFSLEKKGLPPIYFEIAVQPLKHKNKSGAKVAKLTSVQALMAPVRGPFGDRAFLVASSHEQGEDWRNRRRTLMPNLLLVAQYVHYHAMVEAGVYGKADEGVRLAPREAECLHWAASGKTVEDIATILHISRRVTRAYLDSARGKLNASNIAHAVARAISLGLVAAG